MRPWPPKPPTTPHGPGCFGTALGATFCFVWMGSYAFGDYFGPNPPPLELVLGRHLSSGLGGTLMIASLAVGLWSVDAPDNPSIGLAVLRTLAVTLLVVIAPFAFLIGAITAVRGARGEVIPMWVDVLIHCLGLLMALVSAMSLQYVFTRRSRRRR